MPNVMDEKEQADRLAAAEALFMISNHGEKPNLPIRPTRRGKKQKLVDYDDITSVSVKKRSDEYFIEVVDSPNRGKVKRGGSTGRGRARGRGKRQNNSNIYRKISDEDSDAGPSHINSNERDSEFRSSPGPDQNQRLQETKKTITGRGKKRGGKALSKPQHKFTKLETQEGTNDPPKDTNSSLKYPQPVIGFTGVGISNETQNKDKKTSSSTEQKCTPPCPRGNLPSLGLVSNHRQINTPSSSTQKSDTTAALPSFTLSSLAEGSLAPNLPSLPAELPFLQLSSQPTPNLSSLGDVAMPQSGETNTQRDRDKSEKFLPLKKRKLHKAEETSSTPTTVATDSPVDGMSVSDSEERYEAVSPEPPRPPFTVQAPPIITMQTLMEIKTALQADDDGDLPLHIAVVHLNMRMVAKLVSLMRIAGKRVDKFNKQQQTPLHLAIKLDFIEAVELLLKFGADINAVDCSGSSALHMAVQGRSTPILRLMLEKCDNAELNSRNIEGLTPLHSAVDNGDLEQVELLLKHGADIDITDGKSGRTPLFRAAESNHKAMVELLLQRGASIEVPNYAGVTVSMAAQGRNLHGVLKLLGSVSERQYNTELTVVQAAGKSVQSKPPPLLYVGFAPNKHLAQSADPTTTSTIPHTLSSTTTATTTEWTAATSVAYRLVKGAGSDKIAASGGGVVFERSNSTSSSEQTKVFCNVFRLASGKQNKPQFESISEPSSPEVKVDAGSDLHRGLANNSSDSSRISKPAGLFSLPDMNALTSQPSGTTQHDKQQLSPLTRPPAAAIVGRISSTGVLHLVPSSSFIQSSSSSHASPLTYTLSQQGLRPSVPIITLRPPPQSPASAQLSSLAQSQGQSCVRVSSSPLHNAGSQPTSPQPLGGTMSPKSPNSPAVLTSSQAKLYETLLRKISGLPRGTSPVPSRYQQQTTSISSSSSKLSPLLSLPVVSHLAVRPTLQLSAHSSLPSSPIPPGGMTSPRINMPDFRQQGTSLVDSSSPPNTPLNLSKPSARRRRDSSEKLINHPADKLDIRSTVSTSVSVGSDNRLYAATSGTLAAGKTSTSLSSRAEHSNLNIPLVGSSSVNSPPISHNILQHNRGGAHFGKLRIGSGIVASPSVVCETSSSSIPSAHPTVQNSQFVSLQQTRHNNNDQHSSLGSTSSVKSGSISTVSPKVIPASLLQVPATNTNDDSAKSGSSARCFQGEYEVFVTPSSNKPRHDGKQSCPTHQQAVPKTKTPVTATIGTAVSGAKSKNSKSFPQKSHEKSVVKSSVSNPAPASVEEPIVPGFPHISKSVHPSMALLVRDILSQQNQLLQGGCLIQQQPSLVTSSLPIQSQSPATSSSLLSIPQPTSIPTARGEKRLSSVSQSALLSSGAQILTSISQNALLPPGAQVFTSISQNPLLQTARASTSSSHLSATVRQPSSSTHSNNIVGFSGAILSVVPGSKLPPPSPQQRLPLNQQHFVTHQTVQGKPLNTLQQPSAPVTTQPPSTTRGKGDNPPRKSSHHRVSSTTKGSSKGNNHNNNNSNTESAAAPVDPQTKINSETDRSLKRYLDAKLRNQDKGRPLQGDDPDGQQDHNNKPMGIFSGDVQRLDAGRILLKPSATMAKPHQPTKPAPVLSTEASPTTASDKSGLGGDSNPTVFHTEVESATGLTNTPTPSAFTAVVSRSDIVSTPEVSDSQSIITTNSNITTTKDLNQTSPSQLEVLLPYNAKSESATTEPSQLTPNDNKTCVESLPTQSDSKAAYEHTHLSCAINTTQSSRQHKDYDKNDNSIEEKHKDGNTVENRLSKNDDIIKDLKYENVNKMDNLDNENDEKRNEVSFRVNHSGDYNDIRNYKNKDKIHKKGFNLQKEREDNHEDDYKVNESDEKHTGRADNKVNETSAADDIVNYKNKVNEEDKEGYDGDVDYRVKGASNKKDDLNEYDEERPMEIDFSTQRQSLEKMEADCESATAPNALLV